MLGSRRLTEGLTGAGELLELAEMEDDEDTAQAVVEDVERLARDVEQLEFQRMFSGKMDSAAAFVDIQAGAGGTEAQDWAEILLRMYLRWCESRGWKTELMEASGGDVAGIKSATLRGQGIAFTNDFSRDRGPRGPAAPGEEGTQTASARLEPASRPALSAASTNSSRSPSSTFCVSLRSTPVRRSLMRDWSST